MSKLSEGKMDMLKKMPKFTRSDAHKKKRLNDTWRRPKGLQSKRRLQKKGFKKIVKVGYGTPKELRHKHRSGMNNFFVETINQLKGLNSETDGISIKNVGLKKKILIIKEAEKLKLKILNLNPVKLINKFEEEQENKKQAKKKVAEKKKKETIEKKVKKEEKKETIDLDQKKIEDKKEKDKVLTKK